MILCMYFHISVVETVHVLSLLDAISHISVVQVVRHSPILDTATTLKIRYILEEESSDLVWIRVRAQIQTKAWQEFILEKSSAQETRLKFGNQTL